MYEPIIRSIIGDKYYTIVQTCSIQDDYHTDYNTIYNI